MIYITFPKQLTNLIPYLIGRDVFQSYFSSALQTYSFFKSLETWNLELILRKEVRFITTPMQRREHTDTKSGNHAITQFWGNIAGHGKRYHMGLNSKPNLSHSHVIYAVSGLRYGKLGNIDMQTVLQHCCYTSWINLVPRVLSYPPYGARERETLENAGHVSPRIWEITNKRFGEGAGKCESCPYRS